MKNINKHKIATNINKFCNGNYTLVVSDMIDNDFETNQPNTNQGYYKSPEDQVFGYTIRQIEDALIHQKIWNAWRDNIKNKYNNATENNLDAVFNR